jgi:glycosyltransferase involved in cell wall biosynthesis
VKAVFEQAEQLAKRGWQPHVVSKAGRPDWYDLKVDFLRVGDFSPDQLPRTNAYVGTFWSTVEAASSVNRNAAAIHLIQGYEADFAENEPARALIERAYQLPTFKVATSPHLADLVRARFGQPCRTVRYGIDSAVFFSRGKTSGSEPLRIVVVGPFDLSFKGVSTALRALRTVRDAGLSFCLVRVSQQPQSTTERDLLASDEYHERLTPVEIAEVFRGCDVVLSASTAMEGFGLPALEAMACGCAAVLSNIPAYRGFGEAVGGWERYAVFARPSDVASFARVLRQLLLDPAARVQLAQAGTALARRYDWPEVGDELDSVMTDALASYSVGE